MIRPITLGTRSFPTNVIQGPLAGISCASFRRLTWRYSQPAFSCTEMMSCKTILQQSSTHKRRYITKDPHEGPVCFQLSSSDPIELAEATKRVTALGADLIDLNCGCPVKKIRGKGAGSRLLTDPTRLYHLIKAMKDNTALPVSIKIRVQGESDERFHAELVSVVTDAGADFMVVHGRHWTEDYTVPCRYDAIAYFVSALKIPVIGNGDIRCLASLERMFATQCAGVMVSRAGVGQPWLIKLLTAQHQGESYYPPTWQEALAVFKEHVTDLAVLLGHEQRALQEARRFAKYYAKNWPNNDQFCAALNQCHDLATFQRICESYTV